MQIDISFRHMEPSDTLRDYADEKIRRVIRKHIRDDFDAQITLSVEKFRHICKIHLTYKGISIKCEESSNDMYQSIDLALDKLERQIHRFKGKLRMHKPSRSNASSRTLDIAVVALPDEELEDEVAETVAAAEAVAEEAMADVEEKTTDAEEKHARIIKHESVAIVEMSIDDAAMKLSLEDLPVLVFVDPETQQTNVIYRLEDGKCGLMSFDK